MKIFLMTDMEGVAGILNHDDWVLPSGRFYDQGRRLLTEEVNAAVDGLFTGGATKVVVADGHGSGGIDPEQLDPRSQLLRGWDSTAPYPFGLDATFDGIGWVGQHAKAGTPFSHLTHTGGFEVCDQRVNGLSIGEFGALALCAMELGVRSILACGEAAFTQEAETLTPGILTAAVKNGTLPDGLDALSAEDYRKAKLGALHLSPRDARQQIRSAALHAAQLLKTAPHRFSFPAMHPPYTLERFLRQRGNQPPTTIVKTHPSSLIALFNQK